MQLADRGASEFRTLDTLKRDFENFNEDGGNIKKAKFFNNVIGQPMFNIPIDQVALPVLHISLGTFLKFFNMLEEKYRIIDLKISKKIAGVFTSKNDIEEYNMLHQKAKDLEHCIVDCTEKIELVNDASARSVIDNPDNEEFIKKTYEPRLEYLQTKLVKVSLHLQSLV
ncbi:uncharacterized protein LOC130614187 [Hydractinia symbiolongicarpus]|uniref:uncharacterized protein LOC130614187 n=1 Tax=Hydractinia symbiolongicarpus TaxID=13093 RepID=UPI00254F1876|nr:uncharacterized protein LOC130614187 [Hydractinia symbiolongicarpus]